MGAFVGRRALSQIVTDRYGIALALALLNNLNFTLIFLDSHIEFACLFVRLFFSLALVHEDFELHTATITWHFRSGEIPLHFNVATGIFLRASIHTTFMLTW